MTDNRLTRTLFEIPKMDCAAEERMVRFALEGHSSVRGLEFDLPARRLAVLHADKWPPVLEKLASLGLGARFVQSEPAAPAYASPSNEEAEGATLRILLGINATMFVVELVAGFAAQSTGLVADSLDMFADAAVYGISLYAVGRTANWKLRAAHVSGWLQLLLALGAVAEAGRRVFLGSEPQSVLMITIAMLALAANISCMYLISAHRKGGAHMRASWIFSTNDVLANLGVIVAGALVAWTGSAVPDLVIGTVVASLVAFGAVRILRLR